MRKIIMQMLMCTVGLIASFFCLVQAWPADKTDERITKLEKQVEIQQREIIFLYAQINYTEAKQIKEPAELKEAIKRYTKKTR